MWFLPETRNKITAYSKLDAGKTTGFVLRAPNPYRSSVHLGNVLQEENTGGYRYSYAVLELCLESVEPMPDGWTGPSEDGLFPLHQLHQMELAVVAELSEIAIDNFIRTPEALEKNS